MLRPRIIPFLLMHKNGLVKTTRFREPKYIGDPINTVRIFNEKHVDEIILADIDATTAGTEPNYDLISKIATECRMPLCYAGGVSNPEQFERIIGLGVEKIAIGNAAIITPQLISEAATRLGSQSIAVVLDIKKTNDDNQYEIFTHNGRHPTGLNPVDFACKVQELGAGEIIINSIDRDGTMSGYDLNIVDKMQEYLSIPMTFVGGAKDIFDLQDLIKRNRFIGAAAGSMFVYKGKYRAVLIQYPSIEVKHSLYMKEEEIR